MSHNTQNKNIAAALHLCERGTTEAIQRKKPLAWIVLFLAMTSCLIVYCEKEIEFKGEQTDSKLVINSIVETGQPVKARISKSVFFLNNNEDTSAPADLVATLYVNGNLMGVMTPQIDTVWDPVYNYTLEPSYYLWETYNHPYIPAVGDVVKITASANGFDDVEASTGIMPEHTVCQIKDLQLVESESWPDSDESVDTTNWQYSDTYELTLELTDTHPNTIDFYRLTMDESHHFYEGYDHYQNYCSAFISEYTDPIFGAVYSTNIDVIDYQLDEPNGTFTDQLFDGRSYTIKMTVNFHHIITGDFDPDPYRVAVYVEHITKDYYNYLNTCYQGDEVDQFFAEPVQTHTNVNGGYGIVAGRTVDTLWVTLPIER